ncbi:hypothetical protein NC653_035513 [Populus alba x Populus x berolinensis]|uniref:Uncharacterized protein n=1 Tax=Populus alba x Populus x berolinensis TaxID=444605 RepID=A0AAD6LRC7_9ROSI|nr:hypothetical protein NC653_035513 [Populus alba x Populus x berolinensis]
MRYKNPLFYKTAATRGGQKKSPIPGFPSSLLFKLLLPNPRAEED